MTLSWTLDHVGPMCRTVEDTALMLNVVAGYDELDPTTSDVAVPDLHARARRLDREATPGAFRGSPFFDGLDAEVASAVDAALGVLRKMTASTMDVPAAAVGQPRAGLGPRSVRRSLRWDSRSLPRSYQPGTRATLQTIG
jgi:aspartyl-tRNA(Asn)/glutamyl-tRNA(Gln) amidotransferase subunit A